LVGAMLDRVRVATQAVCVCVCVCVCVYVCVVFVRICCLRGMLVARNVIFGDRSEQIAVVSQRGER
jgi:hypothetical protein